MDYTMSQNPDQHLHDNINLLEKRLAGFQADEIKLKQSASAMVDLDEKKLAYSRLKDLQSLILKHQVILNQIYTALSGTTSPTPPNEADAKPFGIGEISVIDVPTP